VTDPTPRDRLVDLLADRGAGVVRAQPGDTLVLLMPDDDAPLDPAYPGDTHGTRIVEQLAALLPHVATIIVTGVAGGIVVPPPEQPPAPEPAPVVLCYGLDVPHRLGLHPDQCAGCRDAGPHGGATPAYVRHLLDTFLYGRPLDFHGDPVPIYVQQQLDAARAAGDLPTAITVPCPAGPSCYMLDEMPPVPVVPRGGITYPTGWCAPAADVDTTPTPRVHRDIAATTVCCDLHGTTCEPPSELCCSNCSEAGHPQHPAGVACVLQPGA
jgi:hypothetical protein